MRVTLLAGGTGGTKLAHGFALLGPRVELTVIANVGGRRRPPRPPHQPRHRCAALYPRRAHRSPSVAGVFTTTRFTAQAMLARSAARRGSAVGDADLATHVERTRLPPRGGRTLTGATAAMASALGIGARILPSTDDRWQTRLETDDGTPRLPGLLRPSAPGADRARRPPGRRRGTARRPSGARRDLDAPISIVIGPSNPFVSIGPILDLRGVRDALAAAPVAAVAVSPIVGGRALKGPADRMLASLGHERRRRRCRAALFRAGRPLRASTTPTPSWAVPSIGIGLGMPVGSCRPSWAPTMTAGAGRRTAPGVLILRPRSPGWRVAICCRGVPARIIVPHRGLEAAKTRLASSLSPGRAACSSPASSLQRVSQVVPAVHR